MTLSELRFVVAVAKERNFRRASENVLSASQHSAWPLKSLKMILG